MKPTQREKAFVDQVQSLLNKNGDPQDPEARARRYRERLAALNVAPPKATQRRGTHPVTGLAALILAALMVFMTLKLIFRPPRPAPVTESLVAEVDILSSADSLEFYENLEFYRWMAEATANATVH